MSSIRSLFLVFPCAFLLAMSVQLRAAEPDHSAFEAAYSLSLQKLDAYRKDGFLLGLNEDPSTMTAISRAYELGQQTVTDPIVLIELAANYSSAALTVSSAQERLKHAIELLNVYQKEHDNSEAMIKPLISIGHINYDFAGLPGALQYYRQAFKLADKNWKGQKRLADLYLEAGVKLSFQSHFTAYDYMKVALDIYTSLADVEGMAATNMHLGRFHIRRVLYVKAEQYLKEGLTILGDNPADKKTFIGLHTQLVKLYSLTFKPELANQHSQIIGSTYSGDELMLLYSTTPRYPPNALRLRESGEVMVRFTVNEVGEVVEPVVVSRTGHHEFEDAALNAIHFSRYAPRFMDGHAVATPNVEFIFRFGLAK